MFLFFSEDKDKSNKCSLNFDINEQTFEYQRTADFMQLCIKSLYNSSIGCHSLVSMFLFHGKLIYILEIKNYDYQSGYW